MRVTNLVPRSRLRSGGAVRSQLGGAGTTGTALFGSSAPGPAILGHDGSIHALERCIDYRCPSVDGLGDLGLGQGNR